MESDVKQYKLPYLVLIGRDTRIVDNFKITNLPRLVIIGLDGNVVFYDKFAKSDAIKNILDPLLK